VGPLEPLEPVEPVDRAVRRATEADVAPMVSMLVRAFEDDPVAMFMFCVPRRRRKALKRFFSIQLEQDYLRFGEVWTTEDRSGAAIWAPPSKPRPGMRDLFHVLPLLRELFPLRHVREALRALFVVESLRPRVPHWYLATIGTDPELQGHGIGSALMKSVLERIDAAGEPAYLECSKEQNVPFYARFGFSVTRELTAVQGAPRIWLMWREPQVEGLGRLGPV
jgi:GNAT superfamily N-acetyltransferase